MLHLPNLFSDGIHKALLWQLDLRDREIALYKSRFGKIRDLTNRERIGLGEAAQRIGRKALLDMDTLFTPNTMLKWYRDLVKREHTSLARCR